MKIQDAFIKEIGGILDQFNDVLKRYNIPNPDKNIVPMMQEGELRMALSQYLNEFFSDIQEG